MESITKVTNHPSHNEALIFERSQPGRAGFSLPALDIDETAGEEAHSTGFEHGDRILDMLKHLVEADQIEFSQGGGGDRKYFCAAATAQCRRYARTGPVRRAAAPSAGRP